jgi:AcrR family transcriptional regulator
MNTLHAQDKIALAALELFLARGIKKTSMDEIAAQAGVTRITAYRHFENKNELVRAAFLQILDVLEKTLSEIARSPGKDIGQYLDSIERGFSALPKGDLPTRLGELSRLHPEIYAEFHAARTAAITQIFEHLFDAAQSQGLLREGLNREIVQVYFSEAVIHLLENPQLKALNLSTVEVFSTVKSIFLHGILTEIS